LRKLSSSARPLRACSSGAATRIPTRLARSSRERFPATTPSCSATWLPRSRTIRSAATAGKKICVHGDYDADGICATALAVLILRELGADVTWHLPSRFEEGYGVQRETLARLTDEGCGLVLTVDCGVTAVEEIAEARARGLEVVVTDHHRPGETLPDCPVVATRPSDYPFPSCAGPASSTSSARRCSEWGTRL
jgi:single-stranded-DNA-specific exonuclease